MVDKILAAKVVGGAAIAVVGATVALPLAGFGTAGVVSTSVAALAQSAIGNVAAGSTFAALQSAGVLGLALKTKIALGVGGAVVGMIV